MKKLIKKELMITKGYLLGALLLPILGIVFPILGIKFSLLEKAETYMFFSFMISITTLMSILDIMGEERKAKMDSLFLSLPINRDDIVKSKYIAYALGPILYSAALYISTSILNILFKIESINIGIDFIFIAGSISLIAVAILIPILFKWNSRYRIAYLVIHFSYIAIIFFGTSMLFNYKLVVNLNFESISMVLFIIAIVIYLISYTFSQRLYRNISYQE